MMKALFLAPCALLASASPPPAFDVVIRGGTVYDGSGSAPFVGDVALKGDRVMAVGKVTGREGGDDAIPSGPVNGALRAVFAAERHLLPLMSLPFGVSLAVIAQPKRAAAGERLAA